MYSPCQSFSDKKLFRKLEPNNSINGHPLWRLPVFAAEQRVFLWRFY